MPGGASQPGQDSTLPSRTLHLRKRPGQLPVYCFSAPKRPFLPDSVLRELDPETCRFASWCRAGRCRDPGGKRLPSGSRVPTPKPSGTGVCPGRVPLCPSVSCIHAPAAGSRRPGKLLQPSGLWPHPLSARSESPEGLGFPSSPGTSFPISTLNFHMRNLAKIRIQLTT